MTSSTASASSPQQPASASRSGRGKFALIALAIVAVFAVLAAGGSFAYANSFKDRALPGTTVLGHNVAGKTANEVAELVNAQGADVVATITTDGVEHTASLADIGVAVDGAATGAAAVERDNSVVNVFKSLWEGAYEVAPVINVDEKAASSFASSLVPEDRTAPVNAEVHFDEDAQEWSVSPGKEGLGVNSEDFVSHVNANAPALKNFAVNQDIVTTDPQITTDEAENVVDQIQQILEQPMSIVGPNDDHIDISTKRRNSWLSVTPDAAGTELTISVDEAAVREWVNSRADDSSVKAKDGIEQVDDAGNVVNVVSDKRDGLEITNIDSVADELIAALNGSAPLETTFESKVVEAKMTQAKAPSEPTAVEDGGASISGEKWIDVDLSAKTVTAYKGSTPVWGPRSVVDGKPGWETATGSYTIYHRLPSQDMTNGDKRSEDDPEYYYTPDVPWVQYFYRGYAFHGAPWRSSFGYSGSHGCVNMTVSDAKWLYDWASIGTRVEVHY